MNNSDNDQQRKILALLLCLFLGYIYMKSVWLPYFHPEAAGPRPQPTAQPTAAPIEEFDQVEAAPTPAQPEAPQSEPPAEAASSGRQKYPTDDQLQESGFVTVETRTLKMRISLLGGRVTQLLLDSYKAALNKDAPLDLVHHINTAPYPLGVRSGEVTDAWTAYRLVHPSPGSPVLKADQGELVVKLEGQLPDGRGITKELTFYPEGYFTDVRTELSAAAPEDAPASIEWTRHVPRDEGKSMLDPANPPGYVWYDGQKAQRETFTDLPADELPLGRVRWVSMDDKYFVVSVISRDILAPAQARRSGRLYRTHVEGSPTAAAFSLFSGPKSYEMLQQLGYNMQLNVNFGKTGFISAPLLWLLHFFYRFFNNYGVAIVCLTILVRLLLYPLNASSFRQMKAMQDLKPEIDRIREQITDKQQQQLEMMSLYKKRGVNPMGGCLPVLIQLPIFIGLYYALALAVELRHAPYALWIRDLSDPEYLAIAGYSVPVMVILFVITMLIQQWLTPSNMDPAQKRMMMIMPIVFAFIFANMPAGLTLYYLVGNIISIAQQKAMLTYHGDTKSGLLITGGASLAVFVLTYALTAI